MIRNANEKDLEDILEIHQSAFGEIDESQMVENLLKDKTAEPTLSLLSFQENEPVGHILFSKATLSGSNISCALLAPLGVMPEVQFKGHGKRLMKEGFRRLKERGIDLVFVLGDSDYYTRAGFLKDAARLGFLPPQPIPAQYRDAWMVRALDDGLIGSISGKIQVANAINAPEFWCD